MLSSSPIVSESPEVESNYHRKRRASAQNTDTIEPVQVADQMKGEKPII